MHVHIVMIALPEVAGRQPWLAQGRGTQNYDSSRLARAVLITVGIFMVSSFQAIHIYTVVRNGHAISFVPPNANIPHSIFQSRIEAMIVGR